MHPSTAPPSLPTVITAVFLLPQARNQLAVKAGSVNWMLGAYVFINIHKLAMSGGHQSQSSIVDAMRTTDFIWLYVASLCMQAAYDGKMQAACIPSVAPALDVYISLFMDRYWLNITSLVEVIRWTLANTSKH